MAILVAPPYRPGSHGGPNERTRTALPRPDRCHCPDPPGSRAWRITGTGCHPGGPDQRLRPLHRSPEREGDRTSDPQSQRVALGAFRVDRLRRVRTRSWSASCSTSSGRGKMENRGGAAALSDAGRDDLPLRGREVEPRRCRPGCPTPSAPAVRARPGRRLRKRVMASTSVPLLDRVRAGTFDDRLFYRLNAIHVAR